MSSRPPIWVISLAKAVERRLLVTRSLDALALDFEVFDAVDGSDLDRTQRLRYSHRRSMFELGRSMSMGEVGCAMSHLALYEEMVRRDLPVVAVMEDDAEPDPALVSVLDDLARLPADWDVVTLHALFGTADPRPVEGCTLAGGHQVTMYRRTVFGTQCYVVTRAAAQRLVQIGTPVRMPADTLLFRRRPSKLTVYGIEPSPVREGRFASEVETRSEVVGAVERAPGDRVLVVAGKLWRTCTSRLPS